MRLLAIFAMLVVGCHDDDWLQYGWDDRRVLCSQSINDVEGDYDVDLVEDALVYAEHHDAVALLHAGEPGVNISLELIEDTLYRAEVHHLRYVGYDELDAMDPPRSAIAFAFDGDSIDAWFAARELFVAHNARLSFFVTRFDRFSEKGRAELQQLAADGHHIEAHSVHHVVAETYVAEHGLEAYIADEVAPSFGILRAEGYAPTTFAFPAGAATATIWDRVLEVDGVERVRLSPGDCPY